MDKIIKDKMFNDIINIQDNENLGKCTSARDLHSVLGVGRDFTTWIKGRIKKYGFEEEVDFIIVKLDSPNRGGSKNHGGDRKSVDYIITLDMAKELAMVENNELGKQVRKYFIQMEKYIIQTNQEEQFKKFREKLDILEKENDVYIKDSNFYSIRDIRELLGGSIEIDTDKLKEKSYELVLSIKQEKGYFNSKLTYYNRYHFLVWVKVYKDIFEITSDEKLRIKNSYDELNNANNL